MLGHEACRLFADPLHAQVTSQEHGTILGTGVYGLAPHRWNNVNFGFNIAGPEEASDYHPTAVSVNSVPCVIGN